MLEAAVETPGPEEDRRQVSLQTKIKMIQRREDKCSIFSLEGLNIGRKGELKFLVISTDTEVFIFDIEYFGVNAFKMKPRLSLVNDDDETNVYCILNLLMVMRHIIADFRI